MFARKGRASYLGERSAGHPDPGAVSSQLLLAALADAAEAAGKRLTGRTRVMVALVLVSHSRSLAQALKDTLGKLYADKAPPMAVAAGAGEDGAELGTDATAIMAAVEEVGAAADGVLVLLDMGSAVLSAEMALDLLDESVRGKVCPLRRAAGRGRDCRRRPEQHRGIARGGACRGGGCAAAKDRTPRRGPRRHGAPPAGPAGEGPSVSVELARREPHGLHARPAMRIVQTVGSFASAVQIENLRTGAPSGVRAQSGGDQLPGRALRATRSA